MPQYLVQIAYTPEAMAALIKNPLDRIEVVGKQLVESPGAKIIGGGYAFGEYDMAIIIEAPDDTTMAAASIAISAGGALKACRTTPLLNGTQFVAALKKAAGSKYHAVH